MISFIFTLPASGIENKCFVDRNSDPNYLFNHRTYWVDQLVKQKKINFTALYKKNVFEKGIQVFAKPLGKYFPPMIDGKYKLKEQDYSSGKVDFRIVVGIRNASKQNILVQNPRWDMYPQNAAKFQICIDSLDKKKCFHKSHYIPGLPGLIRMSDSQVKKAVFYKNESTPMLKASSIIPLTTRAIRILKPGDILFSAVYIGRYSLPKQSFKSGNKVKLWVKYSNYKIMYSPSGYCDKEDIILPVWIGQVNSNKIDVTIK